MKLKGRTAVVTGGAGFIGSARKVLGYAAEVTLMEGLRNLLEWYKNLGTPADVLLRKERVLNWEAPSGECCS